MWDNSRLMPRLSTGILVAGGLATLITVVIAWPVFLHPTQLIYGREIVGRHPDPYTLIALLGGPTPWTPGIQLLTDLPAWLLARAIGPVAAFNLIVLLSFPLTAMTAYALGRSLTASHVAGLVAGLVFAFSPMRLAHAAYHPYLLQTQWLPLLVLALVLLVEQTTPRRVLALAVVAAVLCLTADNIAFIGLITALVVLVAFWLVRTDADRNLWPLVWSVAAFTAVAGIGSYFLAGVRPDLFDTGLERPLGDVAFYRARAWAYAGPAVDHPWLGGIAQEIFTDNGINLQLTELQLYLGYGWMILAAVAVVLVVARWKSEARWRGIAALSACGLIAFAISLGPTSGSCEPASLAPGCLLFRLAPAFPMYARFGLVVQLATAVAAGAGVTLLAARASWGRAAAAALIAIGILEYLPLPARAHDVLPTSAHRWLASNHAGRTLDCYPGSATQATVPALLGHDLTFLDSSIRSCGDPQLAARLAGMGYTHVLVRHGTAASKLPTPLPIGISMLHAFDDADLYAVDATPPPVLTLSSDGFFGDEHDGDDWWRWMGPRGRWTVQNTTTTPQRVSLSINLVAIGLPRTLTMRLDDQPPIQIEVGTEQRDNSFGPWTLTPGPHTVIFEASGDPIRASDVVDSGDNRPLTIAFRRERWLFDQ